MTAHFGHPAQDKRTLSFRAQGVSPESRNLSTTFAQLKTTIHNLLYFTLSSIIIQQKNIALDNQTGRTHTDYVTTKVKEKKMTLIEFFDANAMHQLVPVFSLGPSKVIIIYDKRQYPEKRLNYFTDAMHRRMPRLTIDYVNINLHHVEDIQAMLESVSIEETDPEIYINLTGASELMSAAGFYVGRLKNLTAVYLNRKERKIIRVEDLVPLADASELSLDDYLDCLGAKRLNNSHMMPQKFMYDNILGFAEYTFIHLFEWHALQTFISLNISPHSYDLYIPNICMYKEKRYNVEPMLRELEKYGFIRENEDGSYRFTSPQSKSYMGIFGIWLELYVYIHLLEYYDHVYFGVVIDWAREDCRETIDNEIDVVVMHHSEPVLISCKMRKPAPGDVYEIKSLAYNLGGVIGKGVLATTFPVRSTYDNPHDIGIRMAMMNVGLIEAADFKKKDVKKILKEAILPDQFRGHWTMQ